MSTLDCSLNSTKKFWNMDKKRTDLESTHSWFGALMALFVIDCKQGWLAQCTVVIGYWDKVTLLGWKGTNDLVVGHQGGREIKYIFCSIVASIQHLSKWKEFSFEKESQCCQLSLNTLIMAVQHSLWRETIGSYFMYMNIKIWIWFSTYELNSLTVLIDKFCFNR